MNDTPSRAIDLNISGTRMNDFELRGLSNITSLLGGSAANAIEANVLYKYLLKADEAYEELENVGIEDTNSLECGIINRIEKEIEDYLN